MAEKTVDKAARTLHKEIAKRAWQFRMLGMSEPLLTAFEDKDFIARAHDLGYESVSKLWGAVSTTRKSKNGTDTAKPAADTNGSAKPVVIKPASAKERYKTLITHERTFVPTDVTMAALLKVSIARVSHIRSELGAEGYAIEKTDNGFFISPPEPKPDPIEETMTIVEAQLPLPAPTVEPVAPMGVVATIENVTGMWTETDHSVVVRKLAHIEALLEQLVSESRQQRGIFAQLLGKWS